MPHPPKRAEGAMILNQILDSLSEDFVYPLDSSERSRLGFLQWLLSLPEGTDPQAAAGAAVLRVARDRRSSPAIDAFKELLNDASMPAPSPVRRGGRRARQRARDRN